MKKKDPEKVLQHIMALLGPNPACSCEGCSFEIRESLETIHKYFGKKKTREIYKALDYKWTV